MKGKEQRELLRGVNVSVEICRMRRRGQRWEWVGVRVDGKGCRRGEGHSRKRGVSKGVAGRGPGASGGCIWSGG